MGTTKSTLERMLAGEVFNCWEDELNPVRERCAKLSAGFNTTDQADKEERDRIIRELFGGVGSNCYVTPPFHCDFGQHIFVGDNFYCNFGCVLLDCNHITIGDNVLFGPNVHLYTPTHPVDPTRRVAGEENAYPIKIGNNVWLGGGVIVLPGVTIGDNTTIGAGSIVTKDIPPNSVAVGNPCKVIKTVDPPKPKIEA